MQVAITCRHGQIPDDTRDYLTRKSEKLLTYFQRVTAIEVTIEFAKGRVSAELLVDTEHKHNFVARDEGEDDKAQHVCTGHRPESLAYHCRTPHRTSTVLPRWVQPAAPPVDHGNARAAGNASGVRPVMVPW